MSITRVGSTKKFSDGWDNIFSGGGKKNSGKQAAAKSTGKKAAAKKSAKAKGKSKSAKNVAPAPAAHVPSKKKQKKHEGRGQKHGLGDETAKKSAAKRTSKTGKKRPTPVAHQMELF
jgi:hypothetical protein